MGKRDPRVDAYIARAPDFAKPIPTRIRKVVLGAKVAKPKAKAKPPLKTRPALLKALAKNAKARATFEAFSPSHKREYVEWITEAKSDETRQRRLDTAIERMAEGKQRLWRYQKR